MKKWCFLLLFASLLASCSKSANGNEGKNVLHAKLEKTEVSLKDLFSKIEVIPLETNDTALMDHIHRVREVHGKYYILSEEYPGFSYITTMVFDAEGNFLHTIGKKGQGPGEYPWLIYDMDIDVKKNLVYMFSPDGKFYLYRLDGSFVRKMEIQGLFLRAYHNMELLDNNRMLIWSGTDIENDAMNLLDTDSATFVKGLWKDYFEMNWAVSGDFCHKYQGKTYFTPAVERKVYELDADSLRVAYEWDFGKDNYDASEARSNLKGLDHVDARNQWNEMRRSGNVPYTILNQGQMDKYHFAYFLGRYDGEDTVPNENCFTLFYEKATGKSYYFNQTVEGLAIRPCLIKEDAMYQLIPTEDLETLLPVLDESEKEKVRKRIEDDNPCLVKFIP